MLIICASNSTKIKAKIVKFCLIYEALINNQIHTILRIDNSHGSIPHKHVYHKNKKQIKTLLSKNPHLAFNDGQKFILINFQKIKDNYLFSS